MIYKVSEFVQVECQQLIESGEPITFWRNALYIGLDKYDNHMVIFTDGSKLTLNKNTPIKKG